jgi:polar amino acid transport system permease protein
LISDLRDWLPILLEGTEITIFLTIVSMALGLVLGVPIALARLDKKGSYTYKAATFLLEVIRGTPLILQLYYLFYVLPLIGIRLNPIPTALIGLGISNGCFLSEIYRAGIEAIHVSQWEAAAALGLPRWVTLWRIIFPQAFRIVIPPIGNYFIALFKDTALVSTISVQELMFSGRLLASSNFRYFEVFTLVGLIYLIICYPSALGVRWLEKKMARGR